MEKYTYKNNLIGRGIYGEAARLFWRAYPNALTKEKARFYAYHYRTVNKQTRIQGMYFNGFTLLLMILSAVLGFILGVKIEEAHQFRRRDDWLNGERIEDQMERDGWKKL